MRIGPGVEEYQLKRLADVKQKRDDDAVRRTLDQLATEAADPEINLMPTMVEAVKAFATEGEIVEALEGVFGTYVERVVL